MRLEAFNLALKIIQNEGDSQRQDTLQLLGAQFPSLVNEKNLKIQSKLVDILGILADEGRLLFESNEKMFLFNLLDKFLSSNNRSLKTKTKSILTGIFGAHSDPFFEALQSLLTKANPKMTKSLLNFLLSNEELLKLEGFAEIEDGLLELCNKFYNHRMKDIKKGILKLIQLGCERFGEDFASGISKLSKNDKGSNLTIRHLSKSIGEDRQSQTNFEAKARKTIKDNEAKAGRKKNDTKTKNKIPQTQATSREIQQILGVQGRVQTKVEREEQNDDRLFRGNQEYPENRIGKRRQSFV